MSITEKVTAGWSRTTKVKASPQPTYAALAELHGKSGALADGRELMNSLTREQVIEILDRRRDIILSRYGEPR